MKNILFIVNDYLPKPTANGICVKNICEELVDEFSIHIICQQNDLKQSKYEIIDKVHVHRILTNERKKRLESKTVARLSYIKLLKYCKDMLGRYSIDNDLVKLIYEKIEYLDSIFKIDAIISVCFPFESIMAAMSYNLKNGTPFIELLFDKFSDSQTRHRNIINKKMKYERNLSLEIESFKRAKAIIASNDWKEYFSDKKMDVDFIDVPTLYIDNVVSDVINESAKKRAIFAGSLSSKMRPVNETSKILKAYFSNYDNLSVDFYGNAGDQPALKRLQRMFPNYISLNKSIPLKDIKMKYVESDILISIGNIDISQTPSKVFEYIGMRKPIIHFYRHEKDPINVILKKYENALLINQFGETPKLVEDINNFVKSKMSIPNVDELEQTFISATPKYSSKKIINAIWRK
ncbi:hypothetical protein [Enterococcus gallinarum]|uniref:hypothetical protein n=1 Tax=Enterococcus TaxID=1350 RepID=UPI003F7591DB